MHAGKAESTSNDQTIYCIPEECYAWIVRYIIPLG